MAENVTEKELKQNFFDHFVLNNSRFFSYIESSTLQQVKTLEEIYNDSDVNSAVEGIIRSVKAREYSIATYEKDNDADVAKALEIEKMLNSININDSVKNILKAKCLKKAFLEIEFDEEKPFIPKRLNVCPEESFYYKRTERQWYLRSKEAKEVELPWYKFIIALNEQSNKNPGGITVFEPIFKDWQQLLEIKSRLAALAIKYGEVIMLSSYNPNEQSLLNKTEEQIGEILKKRAENIKALKGKEVILVPMSNGANIRDIMIPITLSDLKLESHIKIINQWKKNIFRNIQGSTLAGMESEGSGNYALGNTHQGEKEKVEEDWTKFLVDVLQQLLNILGKLHNFDSSKFYFKFEKGVDRKVEAEADKAEAEVDKTKAETLNTKMDAISKLSQTGYTLKPEALAEILGIEPSDLVELEVQAPITNEEFAKQSSRIQRKKS